MARSSDSYLVTLTLHVAVDVLHVPLRILAHPGGCPVLPRDSRKSPSPRSMCSSSVCLLLAEALRIRNPSLGYFQTIWPLRRAPVQLPENADDWPHIDVLITTYNEPLDVVRYTALGALNMDWPADKMHVYILDDGRRKEFEQFAFEAGIGYRTRPDNEHAKAGNINAALKSIDSPLVAIFDSDHVPTRSFLQMTVGWFLRDRKLAVLQTPHHFYSPDPFERNLKQFRIIPNEGELFYGIVQDGNDFWNASFFCGSCAVLRRKALDDIHGIAVETVTEDAHTALRIQMHGWNTAYINIPQAAGLATQRLSAHIGQRIRWARGMIQILRLDNPLFAPGLTLPQRLCYFNAMGHFLYAVPRLIFLTAPLIYLLLGHINIPGFWAAILAYALPHLALSNVTNSRIQGRHRYSFWNEIYETVLSPYILLPTMMALISPRLGKFNVTSKGGVVKRTFFDSRLAQPFLVMLVLNFAGLALAVPRYLHGETYRHGTVIMNVLWCCFNTVILGVCIAVARELQQRRTTARINVVSPVTVKLANGRSVPAETINISNGGAGIHLGEALGCDLPSEVHLACVLPKHSVDLPATVISLEDSMLRVHFGNLSIPEQEVLTMVLYSRADSWLGWGEARDSDSVLRSLGRIFQISMRGMMAAILSAFKGSDKPPKKPPSLSIADSAPILFLAAIFVVGSARTFAQTQPAAPSLHPAVTAPKPISGASRQQPFIPQTATATSQLPAALPQIALADDNSPIPPGQYRDKFTLADAGSLQIELHGIETKHNIFFTLPETHAVRTAKIHLHYTFSPSLLPQLSHLKLILNGTVFATIEPTPGKLGGSDGSDAEEEFAIPPELLVHKNSLSVEFIGHYTTTCEDPANTALWARVDRSSYIDIEGGLLPMADDLKKLPLPFVDPAVVQPVSLPLVFLAEPSFKAIQAAGIVTSYFGLLSVDRPVRFPVHISDTLPPGNIILVVETPAKLPAALQITGVTSPTVAVRANPSDPYGKVLIIAGRNADDVVIAAQAVALNSDMLNGNQVPIDSLTLPSGRAPDDAPRWARTDQTIPLWDYASTDELQNDGTAPLNVYFRIPPDIYYGELTNSDRQNAALHLAYRYNSIPIGPLSSLQARINNAFLGSVSLDAGQQSSHITQAVVPLPVVNLRPFSNTLSFDFTFQLLKKQHCEDTVPISLQGSILQDSYIDLRGYPHWAPMPNLEIFANAGFPFTREADLSETTVVLPAIPSEKEIETFVTLMGHFSRQTGFPALRVTVDGSDALREGAHSDFLVIGSGGDQPGFDKLATHLPVSWHSGQIVVHDTQGFFAPLHGYQWWKMNSGEHTDSGDLVAGGTPDAIVEGIESPYDVLGNRSVVAIYLRDGTTFEPFMDTFLNGPTGERHLWYHLRSSRHRIPILPHRNRRLSRGSFAVVEQAGVVASLSAPWLATAHDHCSLPSSLPSWSRQWLRAKARQTPDNDRGLVGEDHSDFCRLKVLPGPAHRPNLTR